MLRLVTLHVEILPKMSYYDFIRGLCIKKWTNYNNRKG